MNTGLMEEPQSRRRRLMKTYTKPALKKHAELKQVTFSSH